MTEPPAAFAKQAHLYLRPHQHARLAAGKRGFLRTLCALLTDNGFDIALHDDTPEQLQAARDRPGYNIVRMAPPPKPGDVTFRRTYFAPFWHIEPSAERWKWPVADASFDPASVPRAKAARFAANLRARHCADLPPTTSDGLVLIPLQGRLAEQRSFQCMSPLAMVEAVLNHEPRRSIHATLHPRETYGAAELASLDRLEQRFPRLTVSMGDTLHHLPRCEYVATQNSAVALMGYLLHKPAVLFGRVDFHHIAHNVHQLGPAEALRRAPQVLPDFDAYLWWFLRDHAIDDSRPDAAARMAGALIAAGWPIGPR